MGKPIYNVYIENSASMDGYVNGDQTGFKNDVYDLLSTIQSPLRNIAGSLNLFYINSRVIPFEEDVENFIQKQEQS